LEKRKGARSKKAIPHSILKQLNQGEIETANLVEFLAIDFHKLVEKVMTDFGNPEFTQIFHQGFNQLNKKTVNTFQKSIGESLLLIQAEYPKSKVIDYLSEHPSDVVRRWPCYYIGLNDDFDLKEKLNRLESYACDSHFGVREDAWLAVRDCIIENLEASISYLSKWVKSENPYKRRFAIELLRPRGVWCKHINELKENPEIVFPLIEALEEEEHKYVQDSVANWLNDLSKSQPELVVKKLESWNTENKNTAYIVRRGLRSIKNHKA